MILSQPRVPVDIVVLPSYRGGRRSRGQNIRTQILRELTSPGSFQWNIRESYSTIAKKLALREETVRTAVRQARESGFVDKWRIILNPNVLGYGSAAAQLQMSDPKVKSRVISQIRLIDGVIIVFDFGESLRVVFYYETEQTLRRKFKLLCSISGCAERDAMLWTTAFPASRLKMKRLDWQILKAIGKDPRRELGAVAAEVGVSVRTVNRRLRKMTEGKTFYLIPVRNLKKSSGLLCNYIVLCPDDMKGEIDRLVSTDEQRIDFVYTNLSGMYNVSMMFDNIAEADELRERIGSVPGVRDVKMFILRDFIFVDDWFEDTISMRLE